MSKEHKEACYRTLFEKYPNGQFSAEALYNLFITKYLQKKYYDAQKLGLLHIKKFPNVKLNIMGDYTKFPEDVAEKAKKTMELTKDNTEYTLNLGINYSGQDELVYAINNNSQSPSESQAVSSAAD